VLLGIDWGTTNVRGFWLDAEGAVVDRRCAPVGLRQIPAGGWPTAFDRLFGDWVAADARVPVLLSGMVGSRHGWSEAPYLACPATFAELAARLHPIPGTRHHIIPGLLHDLAQGIPDVIRGEETQLAGLAEPRPAVVCLPGTHSKWVHCEPPHIRHFQTYMTGELFDVLSHHSILAQTAAEGDFDEHAFRDGVTRSADSGGLLHHLFGVRGLRLFDRLAGPSQSAYLSGLLIGHEWRAALSGMPRTGRVVVVGTDALTSRYAAVGRAFGIDCVAADGELAAARGLWQIARLAGLIPS
jgi:2-dehydro-3-deoxygalactonokinase